MLCPRRGLMQQVTKGVPRRGTTTSGGPPHREIPSSGSRARALPDALMRNTSMMLNASSSCLNMTGSLHTWQIQSRGYAMRPCRHEATHTSYILRMILRDSINLDDASGCSYIEVWFRSSDLRIVESSRMNTQCIIAPG